MGKHHSKHTSADLAFLKRGGQHKLTQSLSCPICNQDFPMQKATYLDFHIHIETHSQEESKETVAHVEVPEDKKFPESEAVILPARSKLAAIKVHWSVSHLDIQISREELIEDSLRQVLALSQSELRSEFHVNFVGEHSNDAGGLTKEWLGLLLKELFSKKRGLFRLSTGNEPRYLPVAHNEDSELYILTGIALGKAIIENIPVDCSLCRSTLKRLIGINFRLRDVKYQDIDIFNSLNFIKKNNIDGVFFESFSISHGGNLYRIVEDGENILVTEENKEVYVALRIEYEAYGSMSTAIEGMKQGLYRVLPEDLFDDFRAEDLDYMICGNPVINLKDWKNHTVYSGEYSSTHKVIMWFWNIVFRFDQQLLRELLQFVTGTSRVPIDGFADLRTLRGDPATFKIISVEYSKGALPRAHTCFNRLDLPVYKDQNLLRDSLVNVLKYHTLGFGLD